MVSSNAALIRAYKQDVANLSDADGLGTEEEIVVLTREAVADRDWTPEQQAEIARLDDALVAHWRQFEGVLPNPNFQDRAHWWWFLNEGPQVREQAQLRDADAVQS